MFIKESCEKFVSVLGSKAPVPGGGSACALVAAIGAALGNMVCCLTLGKKKYESVETEMRAIKKDVEAMQATLLDLVQQDAIAFEPLARAYALPTETKEQAEKKATILEEALKLACVVPFTLVQVCGVVIRLQKELAAKGSVLAVSDAGVGAELCKAAMRGAALNVYINTKAMLDREYANTLNKRTEEMVKVNSELADEIFISVVKKLGG